MKLTTSFIWLSIAFLFLTNPSFAQTQELDSLKNLLTTANDTTRVRLLIFLCNESVSQGKEKSLEYGFQALKEANKVNYPNGQIDALYAIALTHGKTSSYAESLDFFKQSFALAEKYRDFDAMINIYNSFGIIYKRIGDYQTSQNYYLKGLRLVDSLQHYTEGSAASIYVNLGILHNLMGEPEKAIDNYNKALDVNFGNQSEQLKNEVLVNLAEIDVQNKDYSKALDKYLKAIVFSEKNEKIELSLRYAKIGFCYLNLNQLDLAENYLQKSIEVAENLSLQQEVAIANTYLAQLMLKKKDLTQAIFYSDNNLKALNVNGEYQLKEEAHNLASDIYTQAGNYPKANYHLKQSMAYQDSLLNETKVREIQNLQIQHDVYLKDKEINEGNLKVALLNAEVAEERKRLIYLGIIAALLLFSAGLLYFRFLAKKKSNKIFLEQNQRITEQNKTIEKINAELEKRMLRAQMNPHFIFNSLNSIQHLIINSKDRTHALKYLTKFSKLLRQVLESSVNVSLSLKEEIDLLKIYLELESLRFDNAFTFEIEVDQNLDVEEHEIPLLLVQPYAENAIVHGLMPKNGAKELRIIFNDVNDYIKCIVEDNGVGINSKKPEQKKSKRPSRGMSITEKRINALKKVSNEQLVTVENLDTEGKTGTRVTIRIPKQETGDYYATEKKLVS